MPNDSLEKPPVLPPEFQQAAGSAAPAESPKVMVSLALDADLAAYFQGETEPADWQRHINGVLRFYMDTNQTAEADFELAVRQRQPEPAI